MRLKLVETCQPPGAMWPPGERGEEVCHHLLCGCLEWKVLMFTTGNHLKHMKKAIMVE